MHNYFVDKMHHRWHNFVVEPKLLAFIFMKGKTELLPLIKVK